LEELKQIKKKQKLVQFEKRVRFLILLKRGEVETRKEAGSKVGGNCGNCKRFGRCIGNGD